MAKTNGLFGKVSGKIANVVYGSWKGIEYARQFVVPGNPQTSAQQANRTLFGAAVSIAKSILGSVLQVYSDPFLTRNSAFAHFIGNTMKVWNGTFDMSNVKLVSGTLEKSTITSAVYAGANVTFSWPTTILGNGQATDKACCCVIDVAQHVAFFNGSVDRSVGTAAVNIGAGRNSTFCHAYLFFADSSTAPTVVSDTEYSVLT